MNAGNVADGAKMAHTSSTNAAGPSGASVGGRDAAPPPRDVVSAGLAGITNEQ